MRFLALFSVSTALMTAVFAANAAPTMCSFNGEAPKAAPVCSGGTVAFCNPKTQKAECIAPKAKEKKLTPG